MSSLYPLWAKYKKDNVDVYHHLIHHSIDVASVAQALMNQSYRSANDVFPGLNKDVLSIVFAFLALHDLGKATPMFQNLKENQKETLEKLGLPSSTLPKSKYTHHGTLTAKTLTDANLDSVFTKIDGRILKRLIKTTAGHHGIQPISLHYLPTAIHPHAVGNASWADARKDIINEIFSLFEVNTDTYIEKDLFYDNGFWVKTAGLITIADWIGSNESFFPYQSCICDLKSYKEKSAEQAIRAIKKLGWCSLPVAPPHFIFNKVFPFEPVATQSITMSSNRENRPDLVIIESPMGVGKTEAAMALVGEWLAEKKITGVYFALPTTATANQMATRVKSFLTSFYNKTPSNLMLLHSKSHLTKEFLDMSDVAVNPDANEDTYSDVSEWFFPKKRGLLAPFGVGTVDQIMTSVLQTKHYFVRLFGLSNKAIIFDEIHAYDAYMNQILSRLLSWLSSVGANVILLSATLPKSKRDQLIKAWGGESIDNEAAYPRITLIGKDYQKSVGLPMESSKTLYLKTIDQDKLIESIMSNISEGGVAAVVSTTVAKAQERYLAIKEKADADTEVLLLHSRYLFGDRHKIENKIIELFGKNGTRPHKAILISTQIIEQSMDLDFDVMYSDYAPVDLILQRSGRIHRHARTRYNKTNKPQIYLINPKLTDADVPDFGVDEKIYCRNILLRTWINLHNKSEIVIPDDIEALIESVYSDACLVDHDSVLAKALFESKIQQTKKIQEIESKARLIIIGDPRLRSTADGEYNANLDDDDKNVHFSLKAATRLIETPTYQYLCLYKSDNGLSFDKKYERLVDFYKKPDIITLRQIQESVVGLSFVEKNNPIELPSTWKKHGFLRNLTIIAFDKDGKCINDDRLFIDPELGLYRPPKDKS